ncbi:MAG: PEP-CTERM sorting domain-containing protein [Gemmatimonadaceae bacterium]|nr:PEP-CTERM sorting domain-containing protein [Gemmatimonadaceae bacterium]
MLLGSFTAANASNGQFIDFALDAAGAAAFDAARGGRHAVGIALRPTAVIPEPSTYALMATGLVVLTGLAWRRHST